MGSFARALFWLFAAGLDVVLSWSASGEWICEREMALFLVGTRFQAAMSLAVIRHESIEEFHLVLAGRSSDCAFGQDRAFDALVDLAASTVRVSFREKPFGAALCLLGFAFEEVFRDRMMFTASVVNPAVMFVFRVIPFLRCYTFDEGQYNIRKVSPFTGERVRGRHWLTGLVFGGGILNYSRNRTTRHYSAFDPSLNLFAERTVQVQINWGALLDGNDLAICSRGIDSVFVLPCVADLQLSSLERERLIGVARTCDIAIRHPRDSSVELSNAVSLNSPAEAFLANLASLRPVLVFHYQSTVAYTLSCCPNIKVIDVSVEQ